MEGFTFCLGRGFVWVMSFNLGGWKDVGSDFVSRFGAGGVGMVKQYFVQGLVRYSFWASKGRAVLKGGMMGSNVLADEVCLKLRTRQNILLVLEQLRLP